MKKGCKIALETLIAAEIINAVVFTPTAKGVKYLIAWTLAGAVLQIADALLRARHTAHDGRGDAMN